ncbi:MAG TPA: TolC family protein [Thermoanaerobaculia bacterium]
MNRIRALAGFVLLAGLPAIAQQQPVVLTLEGALERARQLSPAILAARMRIDETRGRVIGATLPLAANPTVELEGGRRSGETSTTDYGVAIGQDFELPSRRRARIDAARAGVAQEEQRARDVERETLREVATSFLRAVEAGERVSAASGGKQLAEEAARIADRRYAAGDVAQLDVNLARTAVARADAEVRIAEAALRGQLIHLQVLLGFAEPVTVRGSLRDETSIARPETIDRPDVRVLDAEIAEAEADMRLARTLRWPEFGVRASYAREEGDRILLGGVGLTLPVFNRGQEATAVAEARLMRLRAEREALQQTIDADVRGAIATHDALRDAASAFERNVLPLVEENERLALESYDVGQIGLGELLLVRREAFDARRAFIDQLIEMRLAEVELRTKSGVWQ